MPNPLHVILFLLLLNGDSIADSNSQQLKISQVIAKSYLLSNKAHYNLTDFDINHSIIQNSYQTKHNGITHVYLRQKVNGIEVHGADIQVHLDKNNQVFLVHNNFISHLNKKLKNNKAKITPQAAIKIALSHLKSEVKEKIIMIENKHAPDKAFVFSNAGVSLQQIPVKLLYAMDVKGKIHLTWCLQIQLSTAWWDIRIDAIDGSFVSKDNWVVNDDYNVVPLPFESLDAIGASFELVSNVADVDASPFGWHDTNGVAGAEHTVTRGNNVTAQEDLDDNDFGGLQPDGGVNLNFDFTFDENLQPDEGENLEVGIVNLFYWNNIIHDVMYQYGFNEVAGNFQDNNYGNGGAGNDPVRADAQDGSGFNNANFGTPPDGSNPRMQMYRYLASPDLIVDSPASVAATYPIGGAAFGTRIDNTGINGILEEVNDASGDSSTDGCEALVGFTVGKIALIDRGNCQFGVKLHNAEDAGAIAALVINNQGDATMTMGAGNVGNTVIIPSAFIGQSNGNLLRAELANSVEISLVVTRKDRDGDLDNGIIIHEYGHGISNRLTGGPNNTFCLSNDEQMGEGWSDFFALVLTAQTKQDANFPRQMGTYARNSTFGIRQYPYTTDMSINLHTFEDIGSVSIPHGVGSVWAQMLWEVYWNLVDRYGFDEDIYHGNGGNNKMLQLVLDGLKLQPCSPSFVEGRDAILAADVANNSGVNKCAIWKGFAKRGLGVSASSGSSSFVGDETQAFDLPEQCTQDLIFTNGFE